MKAGLFRSFYDRRRPSAVRRRATGPKVRSRWFEALEDRRLLTVSVGALHSFDNAPTPGAYPLGDLTLVGSTLYGTTLAGGADGDGAVFSMNVDGSDYQVLHSFTDTSGDGASPVAGLTLDGSTLYGTTSTGGAGGDGTVFSINTDGSGYQVLYSFSGGSADGAFPYAALTLDGSTLYGTTTAGGSAGHGTLFSYNLGNNTEQLVYSFQGGAADGADPGASLTLDGSTLFGTTELGGSANDGTVFSYNLGNNTEQLVYSFNGGTADGATPVAGLTLVGSALFGTTELGGSAGQGTIFSYNLETDSEQVAYSFSQNSETDGALPSSDLALVGSTLYGTTWLGGTDGAGTVFSFDTDNSDYQLLNSFTNIGSDGASPLGGLTVDGSTLYGTTYEGGVDDNGMVFSLNTGGTGYQVVQSFLNDGEGAYAAAGLTLVDSALFGTTTEGGTYGAGTIFSMNPDGSDYQPLYSFANSGGDGGFPAAAMTLDGSTLYGTTRQGGSYGYGTLFSINANGTGYKVLYSFSGGSADGAYPEAGLTLVGSTLYGTTDDGGSDSDGTVFSYNVGNNSEHVLYSFSGGPSDGAHPEAGVTVVGSTLFGTTTGGGSAGYGTVFSMNADGSGEQVVHSFSSADGASINGLTLVNSTLYGTTYALGGNGAAGTVFSMNPDGSDYQVLHSFTGSGGDGASPDDALTLDGSTLYGTTSGGGTGGDGTVFSVTTGGAYQVLYSFTGSSADGADPTAGLTVDGSNLFGVTTAGGSANYGTVFSLSGVTPVVIVALSGVSPSFTTVNSTVSPSYTAGASAISVDPDVTVSSSDGGLTGATVSISAATLQSGDTLGFTSPAGSGISGSYAAGTLTLSGVATPAQYQAALQSVTFSNATNPSTAARSISIVATDNNVDSSPATEQVDVAAPATVTGLWVKGSSWNSSYDKYLANHGMGDSATPSLGYALQTGSNQSKVLPWVNVNVVEAQFSQPVNVTQNSLVLSGGTGGATPSTTGFSVLGNNTYAWTLSSPLSDNRYEISFASTGTGAVTDANGAGISGNWTNGSSTFPSGNGLAGSGASSDFNFLFNALPGNATRSGAVIGSSDYVGTSAKLNDAMSNANYNPYYDVTGTGVINSTDYTDVRARLNNILPGSAPSPWHAGSGNPATTGGGANLSGAMLAVQEGSTSQTGGTAAPAVSNQSSGSSSSSSSSSSSDSSATASATDAGASATDATDAAVSDFDLADLYT